MKTKTTLSMTEARKNFFSLGEKVQKKGVYYTLTEHGRPHAVIASACEFEKLLEHAMQEGSRTAYSGGSYRVADARRKNTAYHFSPSQVFVFRDTARRQYALNNTAESEKWLFRAQLYTVLVEKKLCVPERIEVGLFVPLDCEPNRTYMEADIVCFGKSRQEISLVGLAVAFSQFEKEKESSIKDLFTLCSALSQKYGRKQNSSTKLVYYAREEGQEKQLIIDTDRYKTFNAWKKSMRR